MNKEKINKAADEFANQEYETNVVDRDCLHKGFYHGALWRINTVWHDSGETPEKLRIIIVDCGWRQIMTSRKRYWDLQVANFGIKRWAYIDDLLPDGKEVQNG